MSGRAIVVKTNSAEETRAVGAALARALPPGSCVSLEGPLGAGKTEFVRGFCAGLDVADVVTSPTYTLSNEYETGRGHRVLHVDAFRLAGSGELLDLDLDHRRDPKGYLLVEWGERAADALPPDRARVTLATDPAEEGVRRIAFELPDGVVAAVEGPFAPGPEDPV